MNALTPRITNNLVRLRMPRVPEVPDQVLPLPALRNLRTVMTPGRMTAMRRAQRARGPDRPRGLPPARGLRPMSRRMACLPASVSGWTAIAVAGDVIAKPASMAFRVRRRQRVAGLVPELAGQRSGQTGARL